MEIRRGGIVRVLIPVCVLGVFLATLAGCGSVYYAAWEKMGKEKRDLLRDQVEAVQDDQKEAAETFETVLDRVRQAYGLEGGDLEKFYDRMKGDYGEAVERSQAVSERSRKVKIIAHDLFLEWEREARDIQNTKLRARSMTSLARSRDRFSRLEKALDRSVAGMEPVLADLNDYVLFLKHNLNARAVGSLTQEVDGIQVQVKDLLADMNRSIEEAKAFLKDFEK
ncbi:MAG: DUF2959 domain-containing protein [Proteobacteria bacterium]|nr:DUF2959 domain-containing protein [Pseudomonadota bacterium]